MPVLEAVRLALQMIRAQKLKSGFSLLGVFIGVASLIGAWSIVNGVNRYMTEKFAQTLFGVNTFQLRRRPMFTPNVPDSVWRAWARRPRIRFSDAEALSAGFTVPVVTAWQSSENTTVSYRDKQARDIELTTASERYFDIKNLRLAIGRAFTAQENRSGTGGGSARRRGGAAVVRGSLAARPQRADRGHRVSRDRRSGEAG
jgi:putative ABC transport system permease protein